MKGIGSNPLVYLWRTMYMYAGNRRKYIVVATLLFVFANIITAVQPLIFAYFLNFIQQNGITQANITTIFFILLLFLLSEIVFWAFW